MLLYALPCKKNKNVRASKGCSKSVMPLTDYTVIVT
jgi:hypothetical protein